MNTYEAHCTMRNGMSMPVKVTAQDQIDAMRRIYAIFHHKPVSITKPKAIA